jgi:hypothetical protein
MSSLDNTILSSASVMPILKYRTKYYHLSPQKFDTPSQYRVGCGGGEQMKASFWQRDTKGKILLVTKDVVCSFKIKRHVIGNLKVLKNES